MAARRLLPRASWNLSRDLRVSLKPSVHLRVTNDNAALLPILFAFKTVRACLKIIDSQDADIEGICLPRGLVVQELDVVYLQQDDDEALGLGPLWLEQVLDGLGALKTLRVDMTDCLATLARVTVPAGVVELHRQEGGEVEASEGGGAPLPGGPLPLLEGLQTLRLCDVPLRQVLLPASLTSLTACRFGAAADVELALLPSLHVLDLDDGWLRVSGPQVQLSPSLRRLRLLDTLWVDAADDTELQVMSLGDLPPRLDSLMLDSEGKHFASDVRLGALPESLTELTLIAADCDLGLLPASLKTLRLSKDYFHPLKMRGHVDLDFY
ncbi:hypothetical protein JKP88DRAFT_286279 [Tribonema minus]|uniref:Uncharacterized protein n=1 Tax=Tribonema minus TaxID=303371 RepID=A0A835ZD76_9STRA|nr:hypothetical protein JKP88DRAFT_286279 [Tribonema minus]